MSVSLPAPDQDRELAAAAGAAASQTLDRDVLLMLRVREGDTAAFAQILARYRHPVVSFMNRMVQDPGVAEELAQELFLRVYRARATYEPAAKFTTWMFRIATHLALNWLRDHKKEKGRESLDEEPAEGAGLRQLADDSPNAEERLVADSRLIAVRRAVEMLPDKQRAAVLMHKYQELEYSQIARTLECSESAVKSLLFRAYERLRDRLAHLDGAR